MDNFNYLKNVKIAWKNHKEHQGSINQLNKSDMEAFIRKQTQAPGFQGSI